MMSLKYSSPKETIKNYQESSLARLEKNDCAVIAIAAASGWDYDTSNSFLRKEFKREFRKGTLHFHSRMDFLSHYGKTINGKRIYPICGYDGMENGKHRMTVGSFVKYNPYGTFILAVKNHAFAIKDGNVIGGNLSDAQKLRRILKGAWQIVD